ncbi:MAG TPA: FGGY-family carbohydrate kinase [Acidocella sp.]|nr:FGGY-family carbohydrate kinase [Acidocella sp.]
MIKPAVIGVDVGTRSARAGVFTREGELLGHASRPLQIWRPRPGFAQQSSADIWDAVVQAVRAAREAAGAVAICGIGFDATCSLVLLDGAGGPVSVDPDGDPTQNVILWMDHRAEAEAEEINATGAAVLRYVGGRISPEMQTPKLLWLSRAMPQAFARAAHFFDLPDFLTWRATGATGRSLCSTVCKWTYLGHEARWDEDYFRRIGLGVLADEGFARIGTAMRDVGTAVAGGLAPSAAAELGLAPGTPVATSVIDAHAGGIGVIGTALDGADEDPFARRLALIGGTSSCHMAVSPVPRFVPGLWGPYSGAMLPGLWLNEGGQSATGALIDHVITTHAAYPNLRAEAEATGESVYERLNARLERLAAARGLADMPAALSRGLHVLPDFHGNRSPRADASLRGMISGLALEAGPDELALLYLATVQALAYGTRHIIAALNQGGYRIDTIIATGGGAKNPLFLREHADATGCRIILPRENEAVLLGAAMLGAVAAGVFTDLGAAMAAMSGIGATIEPAPHAQPYHSQKYAVFHRLFADQMAYRALMQGDVPAS